MDKLRAGLTAAQVAKKTINIFFRDDDVDVDEPSLRRLLQIFSVRDAPIVLGVIPALLTAECISLLKEFSNLAEIVQHGWQHTNHETTGRKCEFGTSRAFAEQFDDIAHGQKRLDEAFGENWFPAFIPPWNRCTRDTHAALQQLGFRVLSGLRDKNSATDFQGQNIPVTLDIYRWQNGATFKSLAEIYTDLAAQITQHFPIGIMLHHKVMHDGAFTFIEHLLDELQRHPHVHLHNLRSLSQGA